MKPVAVLFDIDGTLITTGGAGARSWRDAFQDLYEIPADIGQFSDSGMTDPEVGRLTFVAVIGRDPTPEEMALVGRFGPDSDVWEGGPVDAVVDTERLHFFDPETGLGIYAIDNEGATA